LFGGRRGPGGFSDFFEMLFGVRHGARPGAGFGMRGQDIETAMDLSLEDAYRGTVRTITLPATAACPACGGQRMQEQRNLPDLPWHGCGDPPKDA
jgi:DnaJ-class molecular chaperone